MILNYKQVRDLYGSKQGFKFYDDGSFNLNLFGIRTRKSDVVDQFNDILGVAFRDIFGNGIVMLSKGTTKPGLYWLKEGKLGNENGTFILQEGYHAGCWKLGLHKGYPALVQKAEGVFKGWRDKDQDSQFDYHGETFDDVTGLNMHRASELTEKEKVGAYSAGCQVRQNHNEHEAVIEFAERQAEIHGNSFSYALFTDRDFRP